MDFIRRWSYGLAKMLSNNLNESHQKRYVYYFGLQLLIGTIVKMVILVVLSLALGIFNGTMMSMAFFATLRTIIGGYHMDTYGKCLMASALMYLVAGAVIEYTINLWDTTGLIIFSLISLIIILYSVYKWAPVDTPNKPITDPDEIKKLRRKGFIHIAVWSVFCAVMIILNQTFLVLSSCLGLLIAVFIISPLGIWFFDNIRFGIDKVRKKKSRIMVHNSRAIMAREEARKKAEEQAE
jgi:accessory gene regulator B